MSPPRQYRARTPRGEQRRYDLLNSLRCITVMLFVASLSVCSRQRDPQAAFDHVNRTFRSGNMTAAAEEAEKGRKQFHSASGDWAWKFTLLEAAALNREGMYDQALKLLGAEPNVPASGDLAVKKRWSEGIAYTSLHKFSEAEQKFRETEPLCEGSRSTECGDVASARGMLEMEQSHYIEAQAFFERVLVLARASGDRLWESAALLDLSWCAGAQTHFDEALDWASAAREIALSKGLAEIAQKALGNMGWAYYKLGDLEKAEGMFIEAEEQAEKLGEVASQAGWLADAGYAYMDDGDFQQAERSFQQSLKLAQQINSREDIMAARTALAFVSQKGGKIDDAKRNADEALAMARSYGSGEDVVYPVLVEGRIAEQQHDVTAAEAAFHQVEQSADTPVFLRWEAERSLARLYEDENHPDSADREYRTALSTFEAARCGLHERVDSRLPFLTNAARIYEDYIHFLVAEGKTNDALRVADYTRARTLAEGLGRTCKPTFAPDPLNAPEIARRAGGTILFYALGQEHSYLWVITARQIRLLPLSVNQSEIDAAVDRYRKKLEGPHEILEASNDGSVLYKILVAPAHDLLKKRELSKNGNVFIIPDGGLNSLNFETLVSENVSENLVPENKNDAPRSQISPRQVSQSNAAPTKRYWIEDVTITNAASLRLLPASHATRIKPAGRLLLLGNPVAPDADPDNPYPELPNAAAQMENIEKYFPGERQEVFARAQASPSAYINSHPERFSYIHFVAHGTASRLNPLDSAIILSRGAASGPTAGQDDSFKLYARDIINRPLRADLVTISACYSTGKRTYSGEGLVGLSWAFLRAGAHNVIGALWDVSDASTSQFVDEFYGELQKGKSPAVALRTAKLSLLHTGAFRNPFYWAPFQLYTGS